MSLYANNEKYMAFIMECGDKLNGGQTDFASDVYRLVMSIPRGRVLTYGAIATLLGKPGAARQVGKLMASAPAGLCAHRVVNSAGRTAPGWAEQRDLLEREGVGFRENGHVDIKRYILKK